MQKKKKLNLLEWFMILVITIFTIYFTFIDTENTKLYLIVDAITAITGIICVVLCANDSIQYILTPPKNKCVKIDN